MQKIAIMIALLSTCLIAKEDIRSLQYDGVDTTYHGEEIVVKREKDKACYKVAITPKNIFGGSFSGKDVPKPCQRSFVVSLGVVQLMKLDDEIETVGELEVLNFMQKLDFDPEEYIIVDARAEEWYHKLTIPHAVNIPKNSIQEGKEFLEVFEHHLKELGIRKDKHGVLDFTKAKNTIVFCNGSWCTQSAKAIKALVKLGYPKKKLKWYRGGLQDWVSLGFTSIKGK